MKSIYILYFEHTCLYNFKLRPSVRPSVRPLSVGRTDSPSVSLSVFVTHFSSCLYIYCLDFLFTANKPGEILRHVFIV